MAQKRSPRHDGRRSLGFGRRLRGHRIFQAVDLTAQVTDLDAASNPLAAKLAPSKAAVVEIIDGEKFS